MLQEINWGIFNAKFNGKEQKSFEWLCYLLFCKEFNQLTGVFRYLNQAGIETNPIELNGEKIGWQAKFYTTELSKHKNDFLTSIDTSISKHPEITKIIFYINKDFPQGRNQNDPKYKIEIENHAKYKGISVDWRTASFFDSPFVCEENKIIAQYFFTLGKGVFDFICELSQHSNSLLKPIHSTIIFNNSEIKIDRTNITESIRAQLSNNSILILSGEAGVGKTAVIKDFYNQIKEVAPLFVFKATEFNITNINQLFNSYGNFTMSDFINEHNNIGEKYIVIDSAEKLSEIYHKEVFQEFISSLLDSSWKIIFTTRNSYLDDLEYQFVDVFHLNFRIFVIKNLIKKELEELSKSYEFILPTNDRLIELLYNPFYLNEYLRNYHSLDFKVSYSEFKNILWNKQISKSDFRSNNMHIRRENCFLLLAQKRVNEGVFYVKADDFDDEILHRLEHDEIIKYDSTVGGYFITHDIYEEWALEKIIERAFQNSNNYKDFYKEIGSSLPIRRSFRNWLSEKLYLVPENIKVIIENSIIDEEIDGYWKDEVLVSVLLSDYSRTFFDLFSNKLLENEQALLIKCVFLLRIACKEIDESSLYLLGLSKLDEIALKALFTKPKGNGWNTTIDFINKHKKEIELVYINTIIPLLYDWNNKSKEGETTKKATQIALFFYDEISSSGRLRYNSRDVTKKQLINIILNGSFEIKNELSEIINKALSNKVIQYGSKYYDLFHTILSSVTDSFEIAKNLPEQVIALADKIWFHNPDDETYNSRSLPEIEKHFCLSPNHQDYFPSSSFKTPIFNLLRSSPKQTVDFILSLTNKAVECYSKSELGYEVEEAIIFIDDTHSIKQFISDRLWKTYRGTHVSTYLLESIHMALEKWLLEIAEQYSTEIIENWCLYLIRNSRSASITAVVTSIVFAQPFKLFNIAKILLKTKLFFDYDKSRWLVDLHQKNTLLSFKNNFGINYKNELYDDERIDACDDKHRQIDLESLAIRYQFFRGKEDSEIEFHDKQTILWNIFDEFYKQLQQNKRETVNDKRWRLCLARMDRRKMHPEIEEKNGQFLITFNPDIEPELEKYREETLHNSTEKIKHIPLQLWATYRLEKDESKYKLYPQYENSINEVLSETKEIIEELKDSTNNEIVLMNRTIPSYVCAVLVNNFFDKLNSEEQDFCKNILIETANNILLNEHYQYQISDGTEPAISSLPLLMHYFPHNKEDIKLLLFLLLLTQKNEICIFTTRAILNNLWGTNSKDAHSFFIGFLLLKPKYEIIRVKENKNANHKGIFEISNKKVLDIFMKQNKQELDNFVLNMLSYESVKDISNIDIGILITAFDLLPFSERNIDHEKFLEIILPVFAKIIFSDDDRSEYTYINSFLEKFAYLVLTSTKAQIHSYIEPFVQVFQDSRNSAIFFSKFIVVEDSLNRYEEFWVVWEMFYKKMVEFCKDDLASHHDKSLIHNYLLAWPYWKENAREWHSLRDREKVFLSRVAKDIGHHPAVIYSLSKILYDIGSNFIEDGILWISSMIQNNKSLLSAELEINTLYYLENLVRKNILVKRQQIKTDPQLKKQVITILDFLIAEGSATGYLLREDIL